MEEELDSKDKNETEIAELLVNQVNYDWINRYILLAHSINQY